MIQKEFIRSELRYRYPDLADRLSNPEQNVGRPLLFESGMRKFGARIIIATNEELNTLSNVQETDALFLSIGMPNRTVFESLDVCVLPGSEQTGAVLNFVQRLFDRLDDWTQNLREAAETGEDAEQLLRRASGMLQNPLFLLDERGHVVASSEGNIGSIFTENLNSINLSEHARESGCVTKLIQSDAPDALLYRLSIGSQIFSMICLASERALYASDEIVFESLAGFLRLMLPQQTHRMGLQRKPRKNHAAETILRALMAQERTNDEAIDSLHAIGWFRSESYAVLAIEPVNGDLRAAQADAICDRLESRVENCCTFVFLPLVFAVVKTTLREQEALRKSLFLLAQENDLHIGLCETYTGFSALSQRAEQARRALNRAAADQPVVFYSDLFAEELAANAIGAFSPELVCLRSVREMVLYDRAHGTNYLETAELYVKHRFNAVKTAGELFIHRSTFLYRLDRIREQFGLDLDSDAISLLHVLYSFQIAKGVSMRK